MKQQKEPEMEKTGDGWEMIFPCQQKWKDCRADRVRQVKKERVDEDGGVIKIGQQEAQQSRYGLQGGGKAEGSEIDQNTGGCFVRAAVHHGSSGEKRAI